MAQRTDAAEPVGKRSAAIIIAIVGIVAPVALMAVLFAVGPSHITVYVNSKLIPLYMLPAVLAFGGFVSAVIRGARVRRDHRGGHRLIWGLGAGAGLLWLALSLLGFYCLLMSTIGTQDGGWA